LFKPAPVGDNPTIVFSRSLPIVMLLFGLVACSSGTNSGMHGGGELADARSDGPPPEVDPGVERFVGRLAMSPTVPFGGAPYCNYKVTLKDIVVDVVMHPKDGLVSMVVGDTMVETIVGSCPYPPAAMSRQQFQITGLPVAGAGGGMTFQPALMGMPANTPKADLTTSLTRDGTTNMTVAPMRWHRTDLGPPFDWVVLTPIDLTLDRVACEPGGIYCFGGALEGAEYGCGTDGQHLARLKMCAKGCPVTQPPPAPHTDERCL
jgi:hypothetical protein